MPAAPTHPYQRLTPDRVLDALAEVAEIEGDGVGLNARGMILTRWWRCARRWNDGR